MQCMPRSFQASNVCEVPTLPPLLCVDTVVDMPSVVLLSLIVIRADPALLAVTVTRVPEIETEATWLFDELALKLPETLVNVTIEVAPEIRLKVLGLALIVGVAGTVTVTGMERFVDLSLMLIRAEPPALAVTLILSLDSLTDATLVLLDSACGVPDTLLRTIVAVVFFANVNDVGVADMAVFLLPWLVSDFSLSAKVGCESNSMGANNTASQINGLLYDITTSSQ